MPLFNYLAVDGAGGERKGSLFADSEGHLEKLLADQGLELVKAGGAGGRTAASSGRLRPGVKLSALGQADFFFRLGIQLRGGLSLLDALTASDRNAKEDIAARLSGALAESVRTGVPLSQGMASFPRAFPEHYRIVIRIGERSGRLAENCLELRSYIEWMDRNWKDFRQAMIYPCVLAGALVAFIFVALRFIFPTVLELLRELEVPLPWITRALIVVSDFVVEHWTAILVAAVCLPIVFRLLQLRSKAFATFVDGAMFRIPYLGEVIRSICVARFLRNLSLMLQAGVIITESLELSARAAGNLLIEGSVRRIANGVANGTKMHEVMAFEPVFPEMVRRMVSVGEQTGSLDSSLDAVIAYYDDIVPRKVKAFFSVLEPALIVTGLIVAGAIAAAVFLPLISLLNVKAFR